MADNFKCCGFTGYRPQKFPFPLEKSSSEYIKFENALTNVVFSLPQDECFTFISGMAMGFDIIAVDTVLLLKSAYKDASISLICAVPFIEQAEKYPKEWKERYCEILSKADKTVLVSDKYYGGCYYRRNRFIVDNSDYIVTWFDGKSGGTAKTLEYANSKNRTVINLFK
ncbi:MAG: DUF1273 domain-containing protein [Clostridia bacterium]|nr:DUF1273 domain-containing protein [Clostridia bacterium]